MKKAKIMLTAIAVFAVVGGALAFKAKTYATKTIYTGALNGGVCTVTLHTATIASGVVNVAASTTPLASACPNARTIAIAN